MKTKKIVVIFLLMFFASELHSKKLMLSKDYYKPVINKAYWFKVEEIEQLVQLHPEIKYQKYLQNIPYKFKSFPPSELYPHRGICDDCFVLTIPNGRARGTKAFIFADNNIMPEEMIWQGIFQPLISLSKISEAYVIPVPARVAVIAQTLQDYYFHWFQDVLGRLALLEMHGIGWDYLYVMNNKKYMKESLELWGIPEEKMIIPQDENSCIQADELIVPSFVLNKNQSFNKYAGFHQNPATMHYVSQKLVAAAKTKNIDTTQLSKRVFISRKDAPKRKILNEDAVFKLFEKRGFVRYELSKLSVAEQIMLFHNAEVIVGEHGAGLTNCLFCKPKTKVIEIFQALIDSGPWWITQVMGLDYSCVRTVPVNGDYFARYGLDPKNYREAWRSETNVSLHEIKKIMDTL